MKKNNKSVWEAENIFHQKTDISRIGKLIYQYEIFKLIKNLPGDILEFGVFKGNSLIRFLTFRSIIENNYSRKIYGFDTFKNFPAQKRKGDRKLKREFTLDAGKPIPKQNLDKILVNKKFDNFELVEGNVLKTLNKFINKNPNLRISLLHLDMDVFDSTNFVLNKLKDRIVKNGIILIDDYGTVEGATKVVDNFLKKNRKLELKKMSFYKVPSFIIKRF